MVTLISSVTESPPQPSHVLPATMVAMSPRRRIRCALRLGQPPIVADIAPQDVANSGHGRIEDCRARLLSEASGWHLIPGKK
jgi:hypothetical protein